MRQLVMPAFEHYTLREITVRKVDQFIKTLAATKSYSMAKQARTVLSLAFGLAVRYDALRENPVRHTARLSKPPSQALALTVEQVEAIRRAVRTWRRGQGRRVRSQTGSWSRSSRSCLAPPLESVRSSLSASATVMSREPPATVRIRGTIVSPAGKPTHRPCHPKTSKSTHTASVPSFTAEVLRERLLVVASEDPEHLIFFSRNHTPLLTNNVRRRLRKAVAEAGIQGVTPHSFRRTVATVIDRAGGADLAAEMLGPRRRSVARKQPGSSSRRWPCRHT
jgi:integrase